MENYRVASLLMVFGVWFQFVIAASVVLFDPNNNTFPYNQIVLSWPGVLEEVHRVWALIILLLIAFNLYYTFRVGIDRRAKTLSILTLILFVLQAAYGAITIWSYDYPPFVVLHEGNAGLLLLVSSMAAGYTLTNNPNRQTQPSPPSPHKG